MKSVPYPSNIREQVFGFERENRSGEIFLFINLSGIF